MLYENVPVPGAGAEAAVAAVVAALTSPVEAARGSRSALALLAPGSWVAPVDARWSWSAVVTVEAGVPLISRFAPVAAATRRPRLLNSLERGLQAMERVSRRCILSRTNCTFNVTKVSEINANNLPVIRKPTVYPSFAK